MCNINIKNIYWKKRDYSNIRLIQMEESHIYNTLKMCKKNGSIEWVRIFELEIQRRLTSDYHKILNIEIQIEDLYSIILLEEKELLEHRYDFDPMWD